MLSHTFTLRIPAELWVRMEKEVGQEYTHWILKVIRERLDQKAEEKARAEKP